MFTRTTARRWRCFTKRAPHLSNGFDNGRLGISTDPRVSGLEAKRKVSGDSESCLPRWKNTTTHNAKTAIR